MSGSSDSQPAPHAWDASGTLWNPITMSSHALGPSDGITPKLQRPRGRSGGRTSCQVPGCAESLVDCKPYFKRHLVCQTHAVSPIVMMDGVEMRFCQQCAKFERLSAFDAGNRSCRLRLLRRNVAKHRSQLAKRVARSGDEPEARPARQHSKHARVPSLPDLAGNIGGDAAGGMVDVDGTGQPGTSSSQPHERSGGSSGEPDTRCWDAGPMPSHFRGASGGEDWRSQVASGPTKRTKMALSDAAAVTTTEMEGSQADMDDLAMALVRHPHSKQRKRRQRAVPPRPRDESNSESRTLQSHNNSQDVNDDVDATLAPLTLGLRLDRRSEDTEPSANKTGVAGATTPELPPCTSAVQSVSPKTQPPPKYLQQVPQQQQQSRSLVWLEERGPARPSRVLNGIHRGGAALYDTISALVTEPAQRSDAHAITTTGEAAARRLDDLAAGGPSFGVLPGAEATLFEDGMPSNVPLAMQALSSRPNLTHSDRQTLESLLGLAPGPFMTLRAMSNSTITSLDEQLYDIMHDVMKEGGSNTGWFSDALPAEAAPVAPHSFVRRSPVSNATGALAAAYTYLGTPVMETEKRGVLAAPDGGGASRSELPYNQAHPSTGYGADDARHRVWGVNSGGLGATLANPALNEMGDGGGLQSEATLQVTGRTPASTEVAAAAHEGPMPAWAQMPQYQPQATQQLHQQEFVRAAPQQHHLPQQQYPQKGMVLHQQHLPSQQHQQQQFQQQFQQHQQHQQQPVQLPQQTSTELQLQELQQQQRTLEHKLQELQQRKMQLQHQQRVMAPTSVTAPASSVTPCDSAPRAGAGSGPVAAGPVGAFPDQINPQRHQQVYEHRHRNNMQQQQQQQQRYHHPHRPGAGDGNVMPAVPFGVQPHGHPHPRPRLHVHPQPHVGAPAPGFAGQPGTMPPEAPKQQLPRPPSAIVAPRPPSPPGAVVMGAPPGPGSWIAPSWGNIPPHVRGGGGGNGDLPYAGHGDANAHTVGATAGALAGGWGASQATESAWDDYYHSPYDTVRLSVKMMECSPYDMDSTLTQEMLHQMASGGGRCNVPPPLASVRPGCVRVVFNATVLAADCERVADNRGVQGRDFDQAPFSARSGGVMAAVRQLAMTNDTAVVLQAGNNQVVSVDKTGREVTPDNGAAAAALSLPAPVLTRASMAAVYIGARGSFQVHGSGLSGPNVEFWGRIQGVHYQLQVQHTCGDSYALIQLPTMPSCGLLVVEAAAGADAALLSDWLALLVAPTERVAAELNGLQTRLPPASMRRLLVDLGSLLDVLPLLSQPVNGVCPVLGQLGGASSACSKNTWRSSSVDPELAGGIAEAGTCCGGDGCDSPEGPCSNDAAATDAGVLSYNMSYAETLSTLASSHGGPLCQSSSTAAASLCVGISGSGVSRMSAATADGQCSGAAVHCGTASGRAAVAAVLTSITDDSGGDVQATSASHGAGPGGPPVKLSAYLLANLAERAAIGEASAFGGNHVGGWSAAAAAFGNPNVRRLLRGFDPSEVLTNGDDETVLQQVLGTEAVRLLLARAVSVIMFFAERMLVDSALCVVSALSELYFAFPDLLRADLAPTIQRGATNLLHAAVRARSLALMLALVKCGPVLGDNVSLAWQGPGGISPLHLVALLAQPYIITGLQFGVPDIREMWHSLKDDNGVSPADLLAQTLQPVYGVPFSASGATGAVRSPCTREATQPTQPTQPTPPAASKDRLSSVLCREQRTVLRIGPQVSPRAGADPNNVDTTSEQGSDFFQTPLPSPSPSTSLPTVFKCCDGDSPSVAVAPMSSAAESSWLEETKLAAELNGALVLSSQWSNGRMKDEAECGNGAQGGVAGMTAVAEGLNCTTVSCPVAGASAGNAAGVATPPNVPFNYSEAALSEEAHGKGAAHEPKVAAGPPGVQQQGHLAGRGVPSFTGLALNIARRLMPW